MKPESEEIKMDPGVKRHIRVWAITTFIGYAICVGLFVLRSEMPPTIFNKPFIFLIEKLIASVTGISLLTGVIIYVEVHSGILVLRKIAEVPIALALYCSTMLYCVSWIWTYS